MEVSAALRRVKRQFGDEYNVVIIDQDIYDWIYDSELDIIRATSDNDLTIPVSTKSFPLLIPDKVNVKRLSIGGKALKNISLSQLDLTSGNSASQGGVSYWYYQGGMVYLWPNPEDAGTIDVTYARTPTQMTVVAPYLQFQVSPVTLQMGTVPNDTDWQGSKSVNITFSMSFDSLARDFIIFNCGGITVADNHFSINFKSGVIPSLVLSVSDGASAFSVHTLAFLAPIAAGDVIKFRILFDNLTDTATLYKINPLTGIEALQSTSSHNTVYNKQILAAAPIYIGNKDNITANPAPPVMRIYGIEMRRGFDANPELPPVIFSFDGMSDLGTLVAAMPTIKTTQSGHTLTTTGDIIVPAYNQFTVPEVYHEDVVKFCLARAHVKNQNFRAAESEMEQYDRRVSVRRNEAQAPETALYKIPDPADYDEYVD